MSRFLMIVTLVGLTVVSSLALPIPDFKSLSSPVMVNLEAAIKDSVDNTEPLAIKFERKIYKPLENAENLLAKLNVLEGRHSGPLRETVIDEVLTKMKNKLNAASNREARKALLEACDALVAETGETFAQYKDKEPRVFRKIVESEGALLRAYSLVNFCKFL